MIAPQSIGINITAQVVHKSRGRFRLRISQFAKDQYFVLKLEQLIQQTTKIKDYRFNILSSSLVVSYDDENDSEETILACLEDLFNQANKLDLSDKNLNINPQSSVLPLLALTTAIVATPLEIPLLLVGGLVVAASWPLWQRVTNSQNDLNNFDNLNALWLGSQLIQGNSIAGALSINFSQMGENLRQFQSQKIEQELKGSLKNVVDFSSDIKWVESLEETELMEKVKPVAQKVILPTLFLAGITSLITNDIARATSWLPLNLGLSLRGITPLGIVSSLNKAAQSGFYIRDGKTLERLAKVDTLLISSKSLESGKLPTLLKSDLLNLDLCIVIYKPVENLQNWIDRLEIPDVNLYDLSTTEELDTIIQSLKERGKNVAWLEDSLLEPTKADIVITNQGSDIALRQKNDLRCIVDTLNLADETMSTIYQSLAMTTSLNVTAVFMGVALGIDPIYTVSVNAGAAIVGELNSLRLHQ